MNHYFEKVFRFCCDEIGVYEFVNKFCPRSDDRRKFQPDGEWLRNIGTQFPGAKSYWTEIGLKKYIESGMRDWHYSVIDGQAKLVVIEATIEVLYRDPHQIIGHLNEVKSSEEYLFKYLGERPAKIFSSNEPDRFIQYEVNPRLFTPRI